MSQPFPKSIKNCSVCNYWGGNRQLHPYGEHAIVDSYSSKGKCTLRGGNFSGQEMVASGGCSKWQAWGALK